MDITKARLKQLIKEEMNSFLDEEDVELNDPMGGSVDAPLGHEEESEFSIDDIESEDSSDIGLAAQEVLAILEKRGLSPEDIAQVGEQLAAGTGEEMPPEHEEFEI